MENIKTIDKKSQLCIHSEEYMDVMGQPAMIVKTYAMHLFLFILVFVVLGCWFVKCPDAVSGRVVVSEPTSVVQVVSKNDGLLSNLLVEDNEKVDEGQILGVIDNTAKYSDVIALKEIVRSWLNGKCNNNSFVNVVNEANYELGDLQKSFGDLLMFIQHNNLSRQNALSVLKVLCRNLLVEIQNWEMLYLLRSPVKGTVCFVNIEGTNQYVFKNSCLFTVKSERYHDVVGKTLLPANGIGEINRNAKCIISIDNYPSEDYGLLEGVVKSVGSFPVDGNNYMVTIEFPDGLVTNIGKELPRTNQMIGNVQIYVQDRRLYELILQPIKGFLKI